MLESRYFQVMDGIPSERRVRQLGGALPSEALPSEALASKRHQVHERQVHERQAHERQVHVRQAHERQVQQRRQLASDGFFSVQARVLPVPGVRVEMAVDALATVDAAVVGTWAGGMVIEAVAAPEVQRHLFDAPLPPPHLPAPPSSPAPSPPPPTPPTPTPTPSVAPSAKSPASQSPPLSSSDEAQGTKGGGGAGLIAGAVVGAAVVLAVVLLAVVCLRRRRNRAEATKPKAPPKQKPTLVTHEMPIGHESVTHETPFGHASLGEVAVEMKAQEETGIEGSMVGRGNTSKVEVQVEEEKSPPPPMGIPPPQEAESAPQPQMGMTPPAYEVEAIPYNQGQAATYQSAFD